MRGKLPQSGANRLPGSMVKRRAASSLLSAEKNFRRIMGYKDLCMLKATLKEDVDKQEKVA